MSVDDPVGFSIGPRMFGFHITFENGWTVSVQFGGGNYCSNYDEPILPGADYIAPVAATAEIAAWDKEHRWHDFGEDTVAGYQTPAMVLAFMNEIAAK